MNKNIFHILVVDDDNRIRELIKEYLEENGFLITTAKDSFHAKKKLEIIKFDILILDIMMPGESGLSLTREVKKNSSTPIILLTAKGETRDRIEGLELGADDYIGKPFEPKELLLRINNILSKVEKPVTPDEVYIGKALINLKKLDIKINNLLVDVSHNPLGSKVLADYLDTLNCKKHMILGMMLNKDHNKYLSYFKGKISSLTTIDIPNQKNAIKRKELKNKL